jgi:hypothetical protein
MKSPQASILAADEEIAVLEGEIARLQLQLFVAKKPSLGPDLVHRTSSHTNTLLPTSLPYNVGLFVEEKKPDVETQVAHMQAELIVTKKRRNRFTPLCWIPDELLAQILAQTQLSPTRKPNSEYSTSLYNFAYHEEWWSITLVCSHLYETAMSSPELWAYITTGWPTTRISAYLTRSGAVRLVLNHASAKPASTILDPQELGVQWDKIVTLGGSRFARSHALSVTQPRQLNTKVQGMEQVIHRSHPNSNLAILHWNLRNDEIDFVEMLSWYPALTEFSITKGFVKVDAPALNVAIRTTPIPMFPLLTRLNIEQMWGNTNLRSLFELLKNTPCLTELILDRYHATLSCPYHPGVYERKVKLPRLRILVIHGMPEMVRVLLMALSWHFPLLQDLVVKDVSRSTRRSKLDVFPDVLALWRHVAYSIPDANESVPLAGTYVWVPNKVQVLGLEVRTLHGTASRLSVPPTRKLGFHFSTMYHPDDEHQVLYRAHDISFDTLKIEELEPDAWEPELCMSKHWQPESVPWTKKFGAIIARNTRLGPRHVIFDDCHHGVLYCFEGFWRS